MYLRVVQAVCKMLGHPMTPESLYKTGVKYGFLVGERGSRSSRTTYTFDRAKFMEWIEKATEPIPEGYAPAVELLKKYKSLNYAKLISQSDKGNIKYLKMGVPCVRVYDESDVVRHFKLDSENNNGEENNA